jgi:RES domain-containing protein
MILKALSGLTAYRMHAPKWAVAPTSGTGAAKHGGRANRVGVSAIYLALDVETAVLEYQQISPLMPPGTLVSYQLSIDPVADFSGGYQADRWAALWEDFYCDWRSSWFNQRIEPPSWIVGDEVIAAGAKGILFRSRLAAEGLNLVLYTDQLGPIDRLDVYDPQHALPKDQSSWG